MANPSTFYKPEQYNAQADDDEEYEQMNMDDDYEGGEFDENGDFYYKSEKKKKPMFNKGMTKDQQIYGDFINTSSQWDNRDFSSKSMFSKDRFETSANDSQSQQQRTFNLAVPFVKSHTIQPKNESKVKKTFKTKLPHKKAVRFADNIEVQEFNNQDQDLNEQQIPSKRTYSESVRMNVQSNQDEEIKGQQQELPEFFGRRGGAETQKNVRKQKEEVKDKDQKRKVEGVLEQKYGKGLKMLQKMGGFEVGKGVGKNNQGILNPVEAELRKNNQCLGANVDKIERQEQQQQKTLDIQDPEKIIKQTEKKREEVIRQKLDKEDSDFLKLLQESKRQSSMPQKQLPRQKAAPMDQNIGLNIQSQAAGFKIIDMRGDQGAQVMQDLRSLQQSSENSYVAQQQFVSRQKKVEKFKLYHSIFAQKEQIKHSLQTIVNKKNYNENNVLQLQYEQKTLEIKADQEREKLAMMKDFKLELGKIIQTVKDKKYKDNIQVTTDCQELSEKFSDFYNQYKVNIIIAKLIVQNQIKKEIQAWDIMKDGLYLFDEFYGIRNILTIGKKYQEERHQYLFQENSFKTSDQRNGQSLNQEYKNADIMYWLFDTYWLHPMRTFISSKWDLKNESSQLASIIMKWSYLMPESFFAKLIQMYLKPRLKREITDNWNPKDISDPTNLIENWLLPWKQVLGEKEMHGFFVQIKLKLHSALSEWKLDSPLAKALILPWKSILDEESFHNILMRSVIPKLIYSLKELEIDPADQQIEPLSHLFEWLEVLDPKEVSRILREQIMAKWIDTLQEWLTIMQSQSPLEQSETIEEIFQWYQGWKAFIPDEVRQLDEIEDVFKIALFLIYEKLE